MTDDGLWKPIAVKRCLEKLAGAPDQTMVHGELFRWMGIHGGGKRVFQLNIERLIQDGKVVTWVVENLSRGRKPRFYKFIHGL